MNESLVLAYYGCTSPHNLRPLLELIRASNPSTKIVVHRDRDYLTDDEAQEWEIKIRNMNAEPFLTEGVDIESHFLNVEHLAMLNNLDIDTMKDFLDKSTESAKDISIEKYVNGRTDIEKKMGNFAKLNLGHLAIEAPKTFEANPTRYRHSKEVLKELRRIFQEDQKKNLRIMEPTQHINVKALSSISKKIK